jgi:hypothetical protein
MDINAVAQANNVPRTSLQSVKGVAVPLVAALVVILVVYYASLYVSKVDELVSIGPVIRQRQSVTIVGPVLKSSHDSLTFVTTESAASLNKVDDFVHLPPSLNSRGGAQFTYTFWLKVSPNADGLERTLIVRGDTKRALFKSAHSKSTIAHPVAMCPMIRVKSDAQGVTITAHFNSLEEYNNIASFEVNDGHPVDMSRFHLVTIAVHEGNSYAAVKGTTCKIFLDQLSSEKTFKGTLRENEGKLHIFPKWEDPVRGATGKSYPRESSQSSNMVATMRGLTYHNFAFGPEDVYNLLLRDGNKKGVPYVPEASSSDMSSHFIGLQAMVP